MMVVQVLVHLIQEVVAGNMGESREEKAARLRKKGAARARARKEAEEQDISNRFDGKFDELILKHKNPKKSSDEPPDGPA